MVVITVFLLFLIGFLPTLAVAEDTGSYRDITNLRFTTTDNPSALQKGIVLYQLSGDALLLGCNWLAVGKDNGYAASALLAAHSTGKPVRVWYEYDSALYGNGVCYTQTIAIQP